MGALRDFVADMLESEGAAVEPVEPDGLEVLAPEPLRAALGWPEFARLGFGATLPAGAMPIGLEGDWLDRFGALLGGWSRWSCITCGAIWSRSRTPCAAGSTATADGSTNITTICAGPRRRNWPHSGRHRAKRPRPTASARPCGSPPSSANMPPSSTTC